MIDGLPINDAGLYVGGVPAWWNPYRMPDKVAKTRDYLLTMLGPEAWAKKPKNGLLLFGPPGTGKTSAGIAVLYAWGGTGAAAVFQDFGELMIRIRSSWRKDARQTTEQIMAELLKPKILLLDDIGKRTTPEDQETISILFNSRINRNRPTISTTNSDLTTKEGAEEFNAACDTRVAERYRGCEVHVHGTNLRST